MSPPLARVSVLITSYNRERYLGEAIDSCLKSDFRDFELIVVDDCSEDGSVGVAREFARSDSRVRVIENETNLGQFHNRNRALELATTGYVKYHDSDDVMYPHCLATLVRVLEAEPSAGFALSSGRAWAGGPCPMYLTPEMAYQREFLGEGLFHCGPSGALFRTDVLRDLGGFPSAGVASDLLFWLRACASTPIVLAPADLFWYRSHPGQAMLSPSAARDYALAQGEFWQALVSGRCPLDATDLRQAKKNCLWRLLILSSRDLRRGDLSSVRARYRSSGVRWYDWIRYPPRRRVDSRAGSPRRAD